MKLKRPLPFWAAKPNKNRSRWQIYRFNERRGPWKDYYYDIIVTVNTFGHGYSPYVSGSIGNTYSHYAESTVQKFKEINTIPSEVKQAFIARLFHLISKGD